MMSTSPVPMSAQPAPDADRPAARYVERAPRAMTLLLTGKLIVNGREGLCRVRNMSATGMKIETHMALSKGTEVRVDLRSTGDLCARVVWTREGMAGLAFVEPVDLKAVLAGETNRSRILRTRVPRAPRLTAECLIMVGTDTATHEGHLLDISQSGARLRLHFRPTIEERLVLTIPGLPVKSGAVRWTRDAEAGLAFYMPLPFDLLSEWMEQQGR